RAYVEEVSRIDPTAEFEGDDLQSKVINILSENTDETKTVYKFGTDSEKAHPEPKPRTVEDEIREINALMGKSYDAAPKVEPDEDDRQITMDISVSTEESVVAPIFLSDEAIKQSQKTPRPRVSDEPTAVAGYTPAPLQKPSRREFSAPPQRDNFKDRFLDEILSSRVRLIVMLALTALLLVVENLAVFGLNFYSVLSIPKHTGVPAMLDLQFAICLFILACPEIYVSAKKLLKKQVSADLTLLVSLLVFVIYDVIMGIAKPLDYEYPLFAFIFGIHATAVVFASYLKKLADFENFKLITKKEEKKALTVSDTRRLEEENSALDGAVDSYKSKTAKTVRTVFISDFFKRSGKDGEGSTEAPITAGISLAIALVTGIVAYFVQYGIVSFAVAFALTYLLSMPVFSVIIHKLPYHSLVKSSVAEGTAIIGEGAVLEAAAVDVIVYRDTEIFGVEDVNLRNFEGDMTKGLRQMSAIFSAVGGPLDAMFAGALDKKCPPATDIKVEEDGITGKVDGKTVMAGSEEFMLRHGAIFESGIKTAKPTAIATKVMYACENGRVYASFNIRYSFSESFTMLFPTLKEEKTVPLIVTRDPNLNNELVMALAVGTDTIRVLKKLDPDVNDTPERKTSAGIVTVGDKTSLVTSVLNCKKYSALNRRMNVSRIICAFVGAGLGALLSLGNMASAPTAFFGLWQLGWCVAIAIFAWREFAQKKEKGIENDL
ncbi:MAG: hypothetical protein IIX96_04360, partial [Clostridia bacterium]|nr:hypothetical protein [Clostridia bacterium]